MVTDLNQRNMSDIHWEIERRTEQNTAQLNLGFCGKNYFHYFVAPSQVQNCDEDKTAWQTLSAPYNVRAYMSDTEWEIERCQLYENLETLIGSWWALNMEAPLNGSAEASPNYFIDKTRNLLKGTSWWNKNIVLKNVRDFIVYFSSYLYFKTD